ncbi:hypothetical protein [Herbaspirillum autotrophicum]|uniref:hypothetical protein n=1 Tax=Herbaspirillum autotrophicum TaxID=180195 RepID=UPI0012EDE3D5|nr:hypothetical protein [Herbaspirillum autotrophicum]
MTSNYTQEQAKFLEERKEFIKFLIGDGPLPDPVVLIQQGKGSAELIVAKNHFGQIGSIRLSLHENFGAFRSYMGNVVGPYGATDSTTDKDDIEF